MYNNPEELAKIAMQIITSAGEGRDLIQQSLDQIKSGNFENVEANLKQAYELIKSAHIAQTRVIQHEMGLENGQGSELLFNHAQDTLMTINSEYNLAKQLIEMMILLEDRISAIERKVDEKA